jgi:HSP20 family protein
VEVTKMTQLMRYEPWWLAGIERQMDELFSALAGPSRSWAIPAGAGRWVPACDVFSQDGDLVVRLDLPGIDPEKDVQVTLQDGTLCITGERREACGAGGGYRRREWHYGPFERGFTLPEGATGEGITASYRDGVLEVVVPKAAQRAEPKQIPVSTDAQTTLTASRHAA